MTAPDQGTYRILDANFNRAREALRVMEDYARFVLDDRGLTEALKEARHELARAVQALAARPQSKEAPSPLPSPLEGQGAQYRDIVGDVGTSITTAAEAQRASAMEVVVAAGKRLSEALRSIEEYGKTLDPGLAAAIEQLRYRGYELERRLVMTVRARERFGQVRLYVIITKALCRGPWLQAAEAALRGGADAIQLREKNLTDAELLTRARQLAELCRRFGAMLIVNDRPDIAVAAGAHGVHVGQDDLPVAAVRRIAPPHFVVGVSTHTAEQIRAAAALAPDYVAVGPMFDSPTKPQAHIAGPAMLREARAITSLPLVAIGGITRGNTPQVLTAAACCLCVCQDIIAQPDVEFAARSFRKLVDEWASASTLTPG